MNGAMHGNFGIAGVQMNVSAFENNVERMGNYLRHIRGRFPWVRMVLFSELAPLGPRHHNAEPLPGPTETRLTELARETGLWLIPLAVRTRGWPGWIRGLQHHAGDQSPRRDRRALSQVVPVPSV